ncbi:divergent polysaccharide deacetylase family protein [uncultured Roseobacter sp.]|uniref:divergent polysaccharide deacetylase family protein n=1 Tax=uncultured Roseobacter sp. TaxID=114847 RepID=UPI002625C048|nr:divergent polysaccharide deacetylase family protein [uncultured Roseobacter sp.]
MARSFIRGMVWGSCVSLSGVVLLSVLADGPGAVVAPETSGTTEIAQQPTTSEPTAPVQPEPVGQAPVAATAFETAPEPDTLAGLRGSDTMPAAVPLAGSASSLGTPDPSAAPATALNAPAVDAPVAGAGQTTSLAAPATEPTVSVSTDSAALPVPQTPMPTAPTGSETVVSDPVQPGAPVVQTEIAGLSAPAVPVAPSASAETSISVDPAQPPVPPVPAEQSAFAAMGPEVGLETQQPETPGTGDAGVELAALISPSEETPGRADTSTVPLQSGSEAVPNDAEASSGTDTATADAPAVQTTPAQTEAPAPVAPTGETVSTSPERAPEIETAVVRPETVQQPRDEAAAIADVSSGPPPAKPATEAAPANGALQGTLGDLAQGIRTNRLPNLGDTNDTDASEAPAPETVAPDTPDETATQDPEAAPSRPVERFAVPAENPDDKPVMAIVLMDGGADLSAGTIGLPALRSFPYPVSFAVDATLPDAAERATAYRAQGFEVLSLVDLPEGANASDAAVTLAAALEAVPEAVGVLEGPGTGVQTTRDASAQITGSLADSGHGFVTQNRGLNTVQKLAARAGVPSAVVFRDFDGEGQSPAVIRRFLDQAAFRATQEGGVVMLGRLREETVTALLLWALQDRAGRVAIVPVSAALTVQDGI